MAIFRVPHWVPAFLYSDDELLGELYSDLTGELPTEAAQVWSSGFKFLAEGGTAATETRSLKRTWYLDDLAKELDLVCVRPQIARGNIVAWALRSLPVAPIPFENGVAEVRIAENDTIILRERRLDSVARIARTKPKNDGQGGEAGWQFCLLIGIRAPSDASVIKPVCIISLERSEFLTRGIMRTRLDILIDDARVMLGLPRGKDIR